MLLINFEYNTLETDHTHFAMYRHILSPCTKWALSLNWNLKVPKKQGELCVGMKWHNGDSIDAELSKDSQTSFSATFEQENCFTEKAQKLLPGKATNPISEISVAFRGTSIVLLYNRLSQELRLLFWAYLVKICLLISFCVSMQSFITFLMDVGLCSS